MKRLILIAAALFVAATLSSAQFATEPRYDAGSVSALVDRVHLDLEHAYGTRHFSGGDRDRLNHAEKELRDFSQKWARGKFDKDQLDGAIDAIQHVLDNNKLPRGQRDDVADDVSQLRGMREAYNRHEIEGARH